MQSLKALSVLDNLIYKRAKINKPYQAIKKTPEYQKFYDLFKDGIKEQYQWFSDNINKLADSAGIDDDIQPITLDEKNKLKGIVTRDMPSLDQFVTDFKIFQGLKSFFEMSAKWQYKRWGYIVKAEGVDFELTNPQYIAELKNRAAYLLNASTLDSTTFDDLVDMFEEGRLNGMTNIEVATMISDQMDSISDARADMIARTESARATGDANHATSVENGATTHRWVTAGSHPDETCQANEDDGDIPIDQEFSSGDLNEPAHPNCECYTEPGEIDLDSIDLWGGE